MREMQGDFHNLFLSLLFILVQGSIRKELVRKLDVFTNTSKFKNILHNITIQMKSLLKPSQVLSSNIFHSSRKTRRRQELTLGKTSQHQEKIKHALQLGFTQQIQTQDLTSGEVYFPNGRRQSPYCNIALSRLKHQELSFFYKALSRLLPQGFSFLSIFKILQYQEGMR